MTGPALTPDEWAHAHGNLCTDASGRLYWGEPRFRIPIGSTPLEDENGDPRRHAIASLCLHEQPFGFRRDDAELALGLAEYLEAGSYKRLDAIGITTFNHQPADALRELASRILALLPPSDKR